jgi:hypothetical protein
VRALVRVVRWVPDTLSVRLETSDHPGRWLRASAALVTPDGQDLDIADFGFFDDLELAFLARVKGMSRSLSEH